MSAKFEFEMEDCTGCGTCVDACFIDVLRWDEKAKKPIAAYPEDCAACFACELICPVQAISVIPAPKQLHPAAES